MKSSRFLREKFNEVTGKLHCPQCNKTVSLRHMLERLDNLIIGKTDAANDAHSGFVIYCRFAKMAREMRLPPKPVYYSFDTINGLLYEPSSTPWAPVTWAPVNPRYDPGPPPPPKILKAGDANTTRVKSRGAGSYSSPPRRSNSNPERGRRASRTH